MLMRPEAAFPYVSATEGAQHPPKKPPRSTPRRHKISRNLVITRSHNETAATLNDPDAAPVTNPRSQQKSPAEKDQPDY